jgi:predicted HTH domain antitoxin
MLYRKKMLSLGKAAQIAGYDKIDFISKLRIENEPIFDYDNEAMNEINENSIEAMKILQKNS